MTTTRHFPNPPAKDNDIAQCEAAIGHALPLWLRERLLYENGWQIDDNNGATGEEWRFLPVLDRSNRKRMSATAEDIAHYTRQVRHFPNVPEGVVVVARAWSESNRLVLLPDPARPGRLGDALYRQYGHGVPSGQAFAFEAIGQKRAVKIDQRAASELPRFRYHPDPVATGAIEVDPEAVCPCCGKSTGWAYSLQPYARRNVATLCPWCIADGSAARRFDADFVDWTAEENGPLPCAVIDELTHRTPGFASIQQEVWQTCCDDACAFLGIADGEQVAALPAELRERYGLTENYIAHLRSMRPGTLRRYADPGVFLFRCLHCGGAKAWVDCS